jgi:membrane-bound lytic murein transglycosylase MltF
MGCKIEFLVLDEETHFKILTENEADFIISGLVYDSLREESFTASLSYVSVNYSLLEKK